MPALEPNTTSSSRPGACSCWQDFVARRLAFPVYCGTTSFDGATEDFLEETQRIDELAGRFTADDFVRRVTVPALLGLEDPERTWSAAMVIEHAVITGEAIGKTLVFLAHGLPAPIAFDADALRPRGARGVAVMSDLRAYAAEYPRLITRELNQRQSSRSHTHPLLGPLTIHEWHCFATLHLRVHRRQLAEIRRRISNESRAGRLPAVLLDPAAEPNPQA
jgi:hypothetical protein